MRITMSCDPAWVSTRGIPRQVPHRHASCPCASGWFSGSTARSFVGGKGLGVEGRLRQADQADVHAPADQVLLDFGIGAFGDVHVDAG
jgi:hypothetical protein